MANITVSIRERIKNADGLWCWTPKQTIPESKLKPTEAQRKGKFYLVWTERGKKHEQKIKEKSFEGAVKAAHAKERHLEDAADGFERPDPLKKKKDICVVGVHILMGQPDRNLRQVRKENRPIAVRLKVEQNQLVAGIG